MVGIEPPQQEARAVGAHGAVHRQGAAFRLFVNNQFGMVVGSRRCAGMMLHGERR